MLIDKSKLDKTSSKACSLQPSDDRPRFQHFFLRGKIPLSNLSAFTLAAMSRGGIEILTTCGRILRKFPILRRLMIICWQDGGGTDRPDGRREKKVICWRNWRQMSFKSQSAVVTFDEYIDETFDKYSDVTFDKYISTEWLMRRLGETGTKFSFPLSIWRQHHLFPFSFCFQNNIEITTIEERLKR